MAGNPGGTGIYGSRTGKVVTGSTVKNPPTVIKSPPKGHTNDGEWRGNRQGGRDQSVPNANAAKAAKAAAAKSRGKKVSATGTSTNTTSSSTTNVTPTNVNPAPVTGNPEDAALAAINNPGYGSVSGGGRDLAGNFDPMAYAKGMSGMQYDPQIAQVAGRIKGIINALPGSLASLHTAFANLDARQATPPIATPLGGNTGANDVAYAAATANTANAATVAQSHSDAAREADWAQRIQLLSGANVNDLRSTLGGLTQAKGDAQAGYYAQGIKTKSDLVSQAIANINSIRAGNDAEAMVRGGLVSQGLKNDAQALANSGTALAQGYYGPQADQALAQGNQTIISNDLAIKAAKQNLKAMPGQPTTLKAALATGGNAIPTLSALIVPNTGIVQDAATGNTMIKGDPNVWVKNGVAQIMRSLPGTSRKKALEFANTVVSQAVGQAHGKSGRRWTQNKNGKWIRPN